MGLFDSKAKRIAQHRELTTLAREALETLGVEGFKTSSGWYEPSWKDPTRVALEYRWWLSAYLDSLVTAVYNCEESDLGNRGFIAELAESVTVARAVIAGVAPAARPKFRLFAFMQLQGDLNELVTDLSRWFVTDNHLGLGSMADILERQLADAKTALTWFSDYKQLDALYEENNSKAATMKTSAHRATLPHPSNYELGRLVVDGETLLKKVRAQETEHARKRAWMFGLVLADLYGGHGSVHLH